MTVTQASLSPDLRGALGVPPTDRDADAPASRISEGALWVVALMSSGLVLAAVLLLGLLARNAIADAAFGGFVSGIAVMIAALGVGGQAYALATAKRQGLLGTAPKSEAAATTAVPGGMRIVPALPPDLGRRRRQLMQAARTERSKRAKAIATATKPRPAPQQQASPRAAAPRPAPAPAPMRPTRPIPARTAPVRPAPAQPLPARPVPARSTPVRQRQAARPVARTQPAPRPAIRMPRPQVRAPRPAAWPSAAPVVRMGPPPMHPHSQAALFQVNAANIRTQAPPFRR